MTNQTAAQTVASWEARAMTQNEFPAELLERCRNEVAKSDPGGTNFSPYDWVINAILRASGHAELVAARDQAQREREIMRVNRMQECEWLRSQYAELVTALEEMLQAVCGEAGFANAVRTVTGMARPALDLAEERARAALAKAKPPKE